MPERKITTPEFILFAITRAALGFGVGLLVSRMLSDDQRKSTGIALTVMGGITTVPLVMGFRHRRSTEGELTSAAA